MKEVRNVRKLSNGREGREEIERSVEGEERDGSEEGERFEGGKRGKLGE